MTVELGYYEVKVGWPYDFLLRTVALDYMSHGAGPVDHWVPS